MILGFLSGLGLLFALAVHNWRRSQLQIVEELKPNCLLTHSPLVFVTGKRSLFYFLAYWNQIPHYLASHGYEVFNLNLPWMNEARRRRDLHAFLTEQSKLNSKIHLFLDASSLREVTYLLKKQDYDCLASVTLIGERGHLPPFRLALPIAELELGKVQTETLKQNKIPLFWKMHAFWTFQKARPTWKHLGWQLNASEGHFLLDRVQFLAERDLLQRTSSSNL
jgi:hypothetical protein